MGTHSIRLNPRKRVALSVAASAGLLWSMAGFAATPHPPKLPHAAQYHFVLHGKGNELNVGGNSAEVKLTAAMTGGRYTIQDEIWPTTFKVGPHYHKEHAETFYLISGHLSWTVGGETHVMGPGDLVFIPPYTVHSVYVVGKKAAHVLFISAPGGYEHNEEREMQYTPQELKRPDVQRKLNQENDFNPVGPQP